MRCWIANLLVISNDFYLYNVLIPILDLLYLSIYGSLFSNCMEEHFLSPFYGRNDLKKWLCLMWWKGLVDCVKNMH